MNKIFTLISILTLSVSAYAEGGSAAQAGGALGGMMPLIILILFFYLFIIRPQQKQRKEHQKMLDSLNKDDRILTSGGIYATVVSVRGEIVEAKIADNVRVQIAKSTIVSVENKNNKDGVVTPEVVKK